MASWPMPEKWIDEDEKALWLDSMTAWYAPQVAAGELTEFNAWKNVYDMREQWPLEDIKILCKQLGVPIPEVTTRAHDEVIEHITSCRCERDAKGRLIRYSCGPLIARYRRAGGDVYELL